MSFATKLQNVCLLLRPVFSTRDLASDYNLQLITGGIKKGSLWLAPSFFWA